MIRTLSSRVVTLAISRQNLAELIYNADVCLLGFSVRHRGNIFSGQKLGPVGNRNQTIIFSLRQIHKTFYSKWQIMSGGFYKGRVGTPATVPVSCDNNS